jgi:hypothetical protein
MFCIVRTVVSSTVGPKEVMLACIARGEEHVTAPTPFTLQGQPVQHGAIGAAMHASMILLLFSPSSPIVPLYLVVTVLPYKMVSSF